MKKLTLFDALRTWWEARKEGPVPPEFRLSAGVHRHRKGPTYLALGLAHDANIEGRVVVVYVPLELDDAHEGPRLAVRTLDRSTLGGRAGELSGIGPVTPWDTDCWLDEVPTVHGDARNDLGARSVPRFSWLGPTYQKWMRRP